VRASRFVLALVIFVNAGLFSLSNAFHFAATRAYCTRPYDQGGLIRL
jgi:hypothetical protein